MHDLASAKEDFAFESTLSSRTFAHFLSKLKANGYQITIVYFTLRDARLAYRRVRHRVKLGGHDIPQKVITRRFYRSLSNFFNLYLPLANSWMVFDNSTGKTATAIAWYINNQTVIKSPKLWKKNQPASQPATLTPDSKPLRAALSQAAKQANRMADAFGLKVPTAQVEQVKQK